jgi:hypothetical protein
MKVFLYFCRFEICHKRTIFQRVWHVRVNLIFSVKHVVWHADVSKYRVYVYISLTECGTKP